MDEQKETGLVKWEPRQIADLKHDLFPATLGHHQDPDATVGRENIEASDIILPSIRLLQGMSPVVMQGLAEGARPGRFYSSSTNEVFDGPWRGLLVYHWKSRGMLPDPKKPEYNGLQQCISRNNVEGTVYGDCSTCPHKDWREGEDGKNLSPLCSEAHNFALLTDGGMIHLAFRRTALKNVRTFLGNWATGNKTLWHHPVVFTVQQKQEDGNLWYVPSIRWDVKDEVPPNMRALCRMFYDNMKASHEAGKLSSEEGEEPGDGI